MQEYESHEKNLILHIGGSFWGTCLMADYSQMDSARARGTCPVTNYSLAENAGAHDPADYSLADGAGHDIASPIFPRFTCQVFEEYF